MDSFNTVAVTQCYVLLMCIVSRHVTHRYAVALLCRNLVPLCYMESCGVTHTWSHVLLVVTRSHMVLLIVTWSHVTWCHVLFQMWLANGLDLHIIPYGCIATGNMMGMIEVVQEAETVAKVTDNVTVFPTCVSRTWICRSSSTTEGRCRCTRMRSFTTGLRRTIPGEKKGGA